MQDSSPLDATGCAAMHGDTGDWKSYHCQTGLPYICKKEINNTKQDFPGKSELHDRFGFQKCNCAPKLCNIYNRSCSNIGDN